MHALLLIVTTSLVLSSGANPSKRPRELWSVDKAFKNADVVLIAFATAHRDARDGEAIPPNGYEEYLSGVITTFEIMQTVKGNEIRKTVDLIHFKKTSEGERLSNGPCLVKFSVRPKPKDDKLEIHIGKGPHWYMLFLKKRADGKYEPVSGQVDPDDSVKIMNDYR